MKSLLKELIQKSIDHLQQNGMLHHSLSPDIQIERTRHPKHGDYASNIALSLAKSAELPPQKLAQAIVNALPASEVIEKVSIAGPGFINFFVKIHTQHHIVSDILQKKTVFGQQNIGKSEKVLVEFVSANPTGPLHVGHGRGAAYGATIANLLETVGYRVHREYYVNDAGRQMDTLAVSVYLRYLERLGETPRFPANGYQGQYVRDIAAELYDQVNDQFSQPIGEIFKALPPDWDEEKKTGDKEAHIDGLIVRIKKLLAKDYEIVHRFGCEKIQADIKNDLAEFGVTFDTWFSERSLMNNHAIEKSIQALREKEHLYQKDGALWFSSSQFGDEKDRVLIRENGKNTYFASDVAYHWNKLQRGFHHLINVFGADHHGYVPRLRAALQALGLNANALQVPLVQFAILYRHGKRLQMSTRSGEFVTLRELRQEVGNDAARFFYIMRKVEQHMDFDLDLAKSKSNENPVYYIQYAHARICSVFEQLQNKGLTFDETQGLQSLSQLTSENENRLLTTLTRYSERVIHSAQSLEPHQLANYLRELANAFHTYYNASQFLVDETPLRNARLSLIAATRQVIQNGLTILGVSSPEKM